MGTELYEIYQFIVWEFTQCFNLITNRISQDHTYTGYVKQLPISLNSFKTLTQQTADVIIN